MIMNLPYNNISNHGISKKKHFPGILFIKFEKYTSLNHCFKPVSITKQLIFNGKKKLANLTINTVSVSLQAA